MQNTLIYYPHDTLRAAAQEVVNFDKDLKIMLGDMEEEMLSRNGVGIAAPQVNRSLRCFLVNFEDKIHTFINPVITYYGATHITYEEGCLSIPGVYADVERPVSIQVTALDKKGREFTMDAEGFISRIIQHEYDHLNGVLFFDHLSRLMQRRILKEYKKLQEEATQNLAAQNIDEKNLSLQNSDYAESMQDSDMVFSPNDHNEGTQ